MSGSSNKNDNDDDHQVEIIVRPRGDLANEAKNAQKLSNTLGALGNALQKPLGDFIGAMSSKLQPKPSEIEVKFALAFEGGANWGVVSFGSEANLDITVTWEPG